MYEGRARAPAAEDHRRGTAENSRWAGLESTPEPCRIALVGPSSAALVTTLGPLIQGMVAHGHDIICFAPTVENAARAFARLGVRSAPLPTFRQGFSPLSDPRSVYRLARILRQEQPDVVAGYSPKGAALAALAGKIARIDHIVTLLAELGRGFAEAPERPSLAAQAYHKNLLRLAFRCSDTAVFFNEENHKVLQRHRILPASLRQFPFNGSGVDLQHFPETALPSLDKGVMFLFAGPLDKRLGVQDYCEAARLLQVKSGNFRCLIAGAEMRGPNAFPLEELKRYRDVVHYVGPYTDPRPNISRSHAFVMPAYGDAVPSPLIEAMSMGRPVITTTSRGCRSAVRGGTNGMLVPPGDPAALASAMTRLLTRPDLIPSMARASRSYAEASFDSRRINAHLLNALGL